VALKSSGIIIGADNRCRKLANDRMPKNNDRHALQHPRTPPGVIMLTLNPRLVTILGLGFVLALSGCKSSSTSGSSDGSNPTAQGKAPEFGDDPASKVRMAALRAQTSNNLKMIGIAMHNFMSAHSTFPPTAICDAQGKPLLSWRVAILPYVEENDLYKQFKLDEPWDSEHNKKLIPKMPKVYLLPSKENNGQTFYRVFASVPSEAGSDVAAFEWVDPKQRGPIRGANIAQIADGTSNTILVAEAASSVEWTKPDELIYHPKKPVPALGYIWGGNCMILLGDGSTRSISNKLSEATLRALITARASDIPGNDY
jgi:hypothetical protein